MKKLATLCLSLVLLAGMGEVTAQKTKSFAGTIKFSIKYEGDFDPQQLANAPLEQSETVMGNFTRSTQDLQGAYRHTINVVDSTIYLLDLPTEKIAYAVPASLIQESLENVNFEIKKREDTKVICGYTCQGYDITVTNKEDEEKTVTFLVYTTEEIGIDEKINASSVPGLKGYALYQEQPAGEGKKIISEAVEVKKKKVSEFDFMIPANYKYYTIEELQAKFGQQGGDEDDDF